MFSKIYRCFLKIAFSNANGGVRRKFESFVENLEGFGKSEFPPLTTCMETPRCSLDVALPVVENIQKYRYILENIDGVFRDFS
jgi:hypothetical protein